MALLGALGLLALLYLFTGLRQINQWEVALRFTLGKLSGRVEPGLTLFFPGIQQLKRIDTRTKNRDLLRQMVITRDNVTTMVDAVVYYRVIDAEKATLAVENYEAAVKDRAKVVLRDVVGETRLDDLLAHREEVAAKVRAQVETVVSQWGLHVDIIGLQDVQLPPQMQEVLAKVAIAERDRKYVVIKSEADVESAKNFAEAAAILGKSPGSMELRRFEALANLSQAGNTKVIFDLAKPFDDVRHTALAMAEAAAGEAAKVRVSRSEGALKTEGQLDLEAERDAEAAFEIEAAGRSARAPRRVIAPLAGLRAGAAALLDEEGRPALAELVRGARVELAGPGERWSMGSREVTAHRVALALPAEAFLDLAGDASSLAAVRAAFARAMRSPDTELAELYVELLLPGLERPWARAYREAPTRDLPAEPPDPEAALAGAAALLEATGELAGAAMLGRAHLSAAPVPSAGTPLTRVVVRLTAEDRARTWREPGLEERLLRALRDATLRAAEQVVVELGVIVSR